MGALKPLKVAIVEDNPAHRETYYNMILLDSSEHQVEVFEQANALLESDIPLEEFDCALLDIRLPDINGIDLSVILRERCPELPIVFITAYSDDEEALKTLSAGAEDYLPKGEYNQKLFMRSIRYATERKKYQVEKLKLVEELKLQKELNRQQKEFVSMVSHEFRTPLAIISSSAQLMEILKAEGSEEKSSAHLEKIHRAVKRLTGLLDNALCYSKVGEGKINFTASRFNLKQAVEEMVDNHQQLHPNTNFKASIDDLPEDYEGDSEILHHILLNLLSNAVKYSEEVSDVVEVNTRVDVANNTLSIDIIDYGRGIPEESLDRIGERFYRAENSIGVSGSGIGLHLVQRLLAMHDGRLELESAENKGTTASIILPLKMDNKLECVA